MEKRKNSDYHSLFDYLRVKVDNRNYDLMFFRMAINKNDKKVKCALKSIQFAVTVDEHSCDKYQCHCRIMIRRREKTIFSIIIQRLVMKKMLT